MLCDLRVDFDDQSRCEASEEIYPRGRVTISAVMVFLTLFVFAIMNDLTSEAITHLLQLTTLIFSTNLESPVTLHHYCACLLSYLDKPVTVCPILLV